MPCVGSGRPQGCFGAEARRASNPHEPCRRHFTVAGSGGRSDRGASFCRQPRVALWPQRLRSCSFASSRHLHCQQQAQARARPSFGTNETTERYYLQDLACSLISFALLACVCVGCVVVERKSGRKRERRFCGVGVALWVGIRELTCDYYCTAVLQIRRLLHAYTLYKRLTNCVLSALP